MSDGSRWRRHRRPLVRLGHGLALGAVAAVLLLAVRDSEPLRLLEARTFDVRARWAAEPARADTGIVFVDIDPASLQAYRESLGRWPWPRDAHAAIVQYLSAAGARLIVFDVMFPEADVGDPEADTIFAEALSASGRVILPLLFGRAQTAERGAGDTGVGAFQSMEAPHPLFRSEALDLGSVNLNADPDGVVRSDRLVYAYDGRLYPSLALAAARQLAPERFGGTPNVQSGEVRLAGERVPVTEGRMVLRWRGPYLEGGTSTYPIYPAFRILNSAAQVRVGAPPDVPMAALRGKVVFVGVTAAGTEEFDARPNPMRAFDPGVLVHATALDDLLQGDWIERAPWWADGVTVAAAALGVGGLTALGTPWLAAAASVVVLTLVAAGAFVAFAGGWWVGLAAPLVAGGLTLLAGLTVSWATEGREKRRVRDLFSRYVSPEYVRRLTDDVENLRLGGQRRELTLLFSDIRGFTSLSERLPAEEVIGVLNEYLDRMTAVVFEHGGTLDKFIGDAVMAFWGAPVPEPRQATRAVEAALHMLEETATLNRQWRERGVPVELEIGIGVHTGEAVVGNVGSLARKLDYTAIGDAVNLASRLESLNKELGTHVIVSESTRIAVEGDYDFRALDEVRVRGKEKPVKIYELRGPGQGSPTRRPSAPSTLALVATLLGLLAPTPGAAQQKARWTDLYYRPGAWNGAQLTGHRTTNRDTDTLALAALVEVYSAPPRWRAEVVRVRSATTLDSEPLVLVMDGSQVQVLTGMGSTPLSEHAAGDDSLVAAVVSQIRSSGGRVDTTPGTRRLVDAAPSGVVQWVVLRRPAARAEFADALLDTGTGGRLGRRLAQLGVQAAGGERRSEVVASAGARGVVTVRTVDGEITVTPDTAAIRGLEQVRIGILDLERFWREGGLLGNGGGR